MTQETKQALSMEGLRARREEILAIASRYGAYNVRVFGSVARNEATPASDVDLFVCFEEWVSLYELSGLRQALQELLQCQVDITEDHTHMKERLRQKIEKDINPL